MDSTPDRIRARAPILRREAALKLAAAEQHAKDYGAIDTAGVKQHSLRREAENLEREAVLAERGILGAYKNSVKWNMNKENAALLSEAIPACCVEYLDEQ
jgi:hypothetical protein